MVMDERAAASLRRQYGTLYRYVRRRSGSREEAEDLTQEVFEAAIAALGQARLGVEGAPLAWLYTVASRRLIDRLRTPSAPRARLDLDAVPATNGDRGYGNRIVEALLEGLNELSETQRRVVVLKVFEGGRSSTSRRRWEQARRRAGCAFRVDLRHYAYICWRKESSHEQTP